MLTHSLLVSMAKVSLDFEIPGNRSVHSNSRTTGDIPQSKEAEPLLTIAAILSAVYTCDYSYYRMAIHPLVVSARPFRHYWKVLSAL